MKPPISITPFHCPKPLWRSQRILYTIVSRHAEGTLKEKKVNGKEVNWMVNGKKVNGKKVNWKKVDGKKVDGKKVDGKKVDGKVNGKSREKVANGGKR